MQKNNSVPNFHQHSEDFERSLLHYILSDKAFCVAVIQVIKPEFFVNNTYRKIYNHIVEYWVKYKSAPNLNSFREYLLLLYEQKIVDNDILPRMSTASHDINFIKEYLIKFQSYGTLRNLVFDVYKLMENGDESGAIEVAKNYLASIGGYNDKSYFVLKDFEIIKEETLSSPAKYIQTGLTTLDNILSNGKGFPSGRLGLFFGLQKIGKTSLLISMSRHALLNGYNVLFISLQETAIDILKKFYSALFKIPFHQLNLEDEEIKDGIEKIKLFLKEKYNKHCDIKVKYIRPRTKTVRDIENLIQYYSLTESFNIDAVFIDYGDLLVAPVNTGKDLYSKGRIVFEDLNGFATEKNLVVWTVSQIHRFPPGLIPTRQAIRESIAKIDEVHFACSICSPLGMKENTRLFYVDASRFTPTGGFFFASANLEIQLWETSPNAPKYGWKSYTQLPNYLKKLYNASLSSNIEAITKELQKNGIIHELNGFENDGGDENSDYEDNSTNDDIDFLH